MFCETFIAYIASTCSKRVGVVTSHGDVEVDEEGLMTMMFELVNTYPPDYAVGNKWIYKNAIHDMDRRDAIHKHDEQKVKSILDAPPPKRRNREHKQQQLADALFGGCCLPF
jgi:hypothetical protein